MDKAILKIENLTKYYGKVKGIENLSLELKKGEIFGLIGPNGAGKSTTIRSIMNLINKTSGKVFINGEEFDKDNTEIKKIIGYLPSEIYLYDNLTVKGMLDYHEKFYEINTSSKRKELVKLFDIDESKKIEDLSLGNLKKLGIILSLIHQPKILILDEPTSGLDPIMQNKFFDLLSKEKERGTTIIYSTHILSEVSKICDRVGIIKDGNLIKIENIENLTNKNLGYVTITSKDIDKIIKDLKIETTYKDENTIRFANTYESNDLLKRLTKYNITKILIEDMNIEDVFMHYYK